MRQPTWWSEGSASDPVACDGTEKGFDEKPKGEKTPEKLTSEKDPMLAIRGG